MASIDSEYKKRLLESVINGDELEGQEIADLLWGAAKIVDQKYIGDNQAKKQIQSIIEINNEYYQIDWIRTPHKAIYEKQPYKVNWKK